MSVKKIEGEQCNRDVYQKCRVEGRKGRRYEGYESKERGTKESMVHTPETFCRHGYMTCDNRYHPTASCDRFNLNTTDSEIMISEQSDWSVV